MGGLESVDHRYTALYERAKTVLEADARVASVSIGGSIGAGTADEWSDLDLIVVTATGCHDDFLASWSTWLDAITPTVFARTPIAPFIISTVTADGLTFDILVVDPEHSARPRASGYQVGMLSSQRFADLTDALDYAVAEQLRGLAGPFITLVGRGEHVRHLTGVPHILGLLTTVFLAESNAPPLGKLWNQTLTGEQVRTIAELPPVRATEEGVVGFGLAVARLVVERSRPLFSERALEWPASLARVAAERLRIGLGIETSDWLY